ncbi:nitrous oxide reductase accessory protein NosL [Thermoflexus sp.]|uniref:nitrous oxide reductase accessory protein NosL n=1 Tax=Thermoflexus sp. TaxID=1969742 RepID=UPI0035E45067
MRRKFPPVVFLLGWLVVAACARASGPRPPDIAYGKDACAQCGMLINDPRFAAAYVTRDGQARLFDDIGCMIAYHRDHPEEVAAFYVRDFEGGGWIEADHALLVHAPDVPTPMGYGLLAFAVRDRAEAFARAHGGRILDWESARRTVQPPHRHAP